MKNYIGNVKQYVRLLNGLFRATNIIISLLKKKQVEPYGIMNLEFTHTITEDRGPVKFTKRSTIEIPLEHMSNGSIDVKESKHIIEIFKDSHNIIEKTYDETFVSEH